MKPAFKRRLLWRYYEFVRREKQKRHPMQLPEDIITERNRVHEEWIKEERRVGGNKVLVDKLKYKEEILNWVLKENG